MKDIENKEDIKVLVDAFYEQVVLDKDIGPFFTEVARLDFPSHLPKMYDFWESIIFKKASYSGNPMLSHIQLNRKAILKPSHFKQWLYLWQITVSNFFEGPNANEAIQRAKQIAQLIQLKVGLMK